MIIFAWDVETNGLPLWDQPSDDPRQPHLVQFAGLLISDEPRRVVAQMGLIVRPDGWSIDPEMTAIHGIDDAMAQAVGVDERLVGRLFLTMRARADLEVGHNISFDKRMMRINLLRHGLITREDADEGPPSFCTQRESTAIVNCPPTAKMLAANRRGPKAPTLAEAYAHFFQDRLPAHDAMADARAAARIYFRLREIASSNDQATGKDFP